MAAKKSTPAYDAFKAKVAECAKQVTSNADALIRARSLYPDLYNAMMEEDNPGGKALSAYPAQRAVK